MKRKSKYLIYTDNLFGGSPTYYAETEDSSKLTEIKELLSKEFNIDGNRFCAQEIYIYE